MINENLDVALSKLTESGQRELYLLQTDSAVQDYWQERNRLLTEMSEAIEAAVSSVKLQYQQQLFELEQDYAMYVSMITPLKSGDQ